MSCQPTAAAHSAESHIRQSAQGNVKSKTFRICAARAGHADPFTAWGPIIVPIPATLHWFHFSRHN
jgi:hypothetical protein